MLYASNVRSIAMTKAILTLSQLNILHEVIQRKRLIMTIIIVKFMVYYTFDHSVIYS